MSEISEAASLFSHNHNLKGEYNLTKIQIKDILASKLGKVMGATLLCVTYQTF